MQKEILIETDRLVLRPLELGDLYTAHEYSGDIENTKYMINLPNETLEDTESFIRRAIDEWAKEKPSFYEFAILLDKKHIGAVSVYLEGDGSEGELGWIINKFYQGKGYATEAAKAVFNFAINHLKCTKIVAHCDYRNVPSSGVMRKIGLSFESSDGKRRYRGTDEDVRELKYSWKAV